VEVDGGGAGDGDEFVEVGAGAVDVQAEGDAAAVEFDCGGDGEVWALLAGQAAGVDEFEDAVVGGFGAGRVEGVEVDAEGDPDQGSGDLVELGGGVPGGDHDRVVRAAEQFVEGADAGGDAELATGSEREHRVQTFVAEQDRADVVAPRPAGDREKRRLVGDLDRRRLEAFKGLDHAPGIGDQAVAAADLRCLHSYDGAVLGPGHAVALAWGDQDALGAGRAVALAEVLDRGAHAAGGRADEVSQLSDPQRHAARRTRVVRSFAVRRPSAWCAARTSA
jgi:hypothetical protein